jgi:hypothetical protein
LEELVAAPFHSPVSWEIAKGPTITRRRRERRQRSSSSGLQKLKERKSTLEAWKSERDDASIVEKVEK